MWITGLLKKGRITIGGLIFVLPALLLVITFFIVPTIQSFVYSFTNWNGISSKYGFIGWKNYIDIINDKPFLTILKNTFYYLFLYVPLLNVLSLLLAVFIFQIKGRFQNFFKVMFYFPNVLSVVVIGTFWKIILDPNFGPLNALLEKMGLGILARDWLSEKATVMPSIIFIMIWTSIGLYLIIYLGGLNSIPEEIYESGSIDGAKWFSKLIYITIPMMIQSFTINIVLSAITAVTIFDVPYVLTRGGPGFMSETMSIRVYFYAFRTMMHGYGVAFAVILAVLSLLMTILLLVLMRKREEAAY